MNARAEFDSHACVRERNLRSSGVFRARGSATWRARASATSPATAENRTPREIDDWCRNVSFEGHITRRLEGPHSVVDVQADDGTTYHVELASAQQLARQYNGAPPAALTFGARVAVIAHPARDGAAIRASFPDVTWDPVPNTVDPRQIRRVDDTFNWGTPAPPTPLNCGPK